MSVRYFFEHPPTQDNTPALSFGIERALIETISNRESLNEADMVEAVRAAFCLAYPRSLVDQHLQTLLDRVMRRIEEMQETAQEPTTEAPKAPPKKRMTLGSQYMGWVSSLSPEQACLFLSDYDLDQASQWYWRRDMDVVKSAVALKAEQLSHSLTSAMEACMYGMGGKYKDDNGRSEDAIDLNSDAGVAALKALGF